MTTVPGFISKSYSITRVEERFMSATRQRFLLSGVANENALVNLTTKKSAKELVYIINMDYNLQKL